MPSETIITELKVLGQRAYVAAMSNAATSTRMFEAEQHRLGRTSMWLGSRIDSVGSKVVTYGARAAGALAVIGGAGAKVGLEFDAAMERSEIGMTTLLRSAGLAKKTVTDVRDFALKAPLFGVDQMLQSAQQLIGVGYDAKKIVPFLTDFSDTLSALGRRPEDLQRMTYAFSQMMSKGQISAEELRGQLGEIFPAQKILAKEMGITTKELTNRLKQGQVRGQKPLMLLFRGMEKEYGGATSRMGTTFTGLMANMRESAKYSLGLLFKPLFTYLEKHAFPALSEFGQRFNEVLSDNRLSSQEKWKQIEGLFNVYLKPLWSEWMRALDRADVPDKIMKALDYAIPKAMDWASAAGPKIAGKFISAWWHADGWTKFWTGVLILSRLGLFSKLGGAAADIFIKSYKDSATGKKNSEKLKTAGTKMGAVMGRAMGVAAVAGIFLMVGEGLVELNKWIKSKSWWKPPGGKDSFWDKLVPTSLLPSKGKGNEKKSWGEIIREGPLSKALGLNKKPAPTRTGPRAFDFGAKQRKPEPRQPAKLKSTFPPLAMKAPRLTGKFEIHNHVHIDGKEISNTLSRQVIEQRARR